MPDGSAEAVIRADGLTRVYRGTRRREETRAVDQVDLEVGRGEVVALLGPNGAGKTTMVRMLACLLRPTEGTATVCGHDIREQPSAVRAVCGVSTESPGLYEQLTAQQYLTFFARMYAVPEGQVASRVAEQLQAAGLWERRDDRLGTFSKGMRQKINIARALVHEPRVVFLDEPTSGLDVEASRAVRQHIQDLSRSADSTFLICTHNLPEAERLCHRIAVMNRGRIVATGSPDELKERVLGGRVLRVRLREVSPRYLEAARGAAGVAGVTADDNQLAIRLDGLEEEVNPRVVRALVTAGADVISVAGEGQTLEDVYLRLVREEGENPEAPA
jgi:ABC-2 type transport system ATP-binding protein